MKKFLGVCFIGLVSSVGLTACDSGGKDVSGVYEYQNGFGSDVKVTLEKKDGNEYNILLATSKNNSPGKTYDWGSAVKQGDYIIRSRDEEKVFEVVSESEIKRLDVMGQPTLKKVNNQE